MNTNIPIESGPMRVGVGLPGYEHLLQPLTSNPTPTGVSQGLVMCGINTTAMGSLGLMQAGIPISHVYWNPYAPIVGPR
jgi:hypothetical protein